MARTLQIAIPVEDDGASRPASPRLAGAVLEAPQERAELRALVDHHFDFIWRSLRRLGVPPTGVDDAAQQVFLTASQKLELIQPGRERSFLFGVAVRTASDARRSAKRREAHEISDGDLLDQQPDPELCPDELLDRKRARARLDEFMDTLSTEVRTAFFLFEGEGMTVPEIADLVGVPVGTIASRLRLARGRLHELIERMKWKAPRGDGK